jgi:REP element-mobilizing transposase RayT
MQKEFPVRRRIRLEGYDYSQAGYYFITICVQDGHEMLGKVAVGRDVLIAPPYVRLSEYGEIADKHINKIESMCKGFRVDKYVIMPNHIHMIIMKVNNNSLVHEDGAMRTSRPTSASVSSIIRSFKTMVSKEIGFSLWQERFHDRIIRDETEYQRIWHYINENPSKWAEDRYFIETQIQ